MAECLSFEDLTHCTICKDVFDMPRMLPCVHSFCEKCLIELFKDKQPGEQVPCPLCRTNFPIPDGGATSVPRNHFTEALIDRSRLVARPVEALCQVCAKSIPASMYCIDCHQDLCNDCLHVHSVFKATRDHEVVEIGSQQAERIEEVMKKRVIKCENHTDRNVELYCRNCERLICTICSANKHKTHEFEEIIEVAERTCEKIKSHTDVVEQSISICNIAQDNFERRHQSLVKKFDVAKAAILKEGGRLRKMVDDHEKKLLEELESTRDCEIKKIQGCRDQVEMTVGMMESYNRFSNEVKTRGGSSDVARVAQQLDARAKELQQIQCDKFDQMVRALKVEFSACNVEKQLTSGHTSLIGKITVTELEADDPVEDAETEEKVAAIGVLLTEGQP